MGQALANSRQEMMNIRKGNEAESVRWASVKTRVKRIIDQRWPRLNKFSRPNMTKDRFLKLAWALSKYDHCGAPSNWNIEFKHEDTIWRWAMWKAKKAHPPVKRFREGIRRYQVRRDAGRKSRFYTLQDQYNCDDFDEDGKECIDTYITEMEKNRIPDAYSDMSDYFT